jgi:hypothetical protein
LEIAVKRYREYLPELWRAGGSNGQDCVWCCELQFRRQMLGQSSRRSLPEEVIFPLGGFDTDAYTKETTVRICYNR